MPEEFRDLRGGDELEPIHLNKIYRFLRKLLKLRVTYPMRIDGWGSADAVPTITVMGWDNFYVGETTTAITARSGTTLGTGTVKLQMEDGAGNIMDVATNTLTVWNASAATMTSTNGIDSGMKVFVRRDRFGDWWVFPLECT